MYWWSIVTILALSINIECLIGKRWTDTRIACIAGNNDRTLNTPTFEDCKKLCEIETAFECRSADYYPKSGQCDLSRADSSSQSYMEPCYSPFHGNLYAEIIYEIIPECVDEVDNCENYCEYDIAKWYCSKTCGFCKEDNNECEANHGKGDCDHICENSLGSYRCSCREGYSLTEDNKTCQDINECEANYGKGDCDHICENLLGFYRCSCREGYSLAEDNKTCQDINECEANNGKGDCNHICENLLGSYRCSCREGYSLAEDNKTCQATTTATTTTTPVTTTPGNMNEYWAKNCTSSVTMADGMVVEWQSPLYDGGTTHYPKGDYCCTLEITIPSSYSMFLVTMEFVRPSSIYETRNCKGDHILYMTSDGEDVWICGGDISEQTWAETQTYNGPLSFSLTWCSDSTDGGTDIGFKMTAKGMDVMAGK